MPKIRILPETLSNQIAAGEVVERPVSVVKELVENSIDAGADQISIEIRGGGRTLIRVSDNGCGMSRDEALLSIERYATSKIRDKEDLFSIGTMGFRGEALPSIASVSRFTLVTRDRQSDAGTRMDIAGGRLNHVTEVGAPVGTMAAVKNLFYNVPARKKFLKSDQTEMGHIADTLSGMALGNPDIRFKFIVNNRLVRHYATVGNRLERTLGVLGNDLAGQLIPVDYDGQGLKVSGFCANPGITRRTGSRIFLFVNNRLVRDRGLVAAIFKGYAGRIMKGRFPVSVLFVTIDFDRVDVNVHPSKREIRFFDHSQVYRAVAAALSSALEKAQQDRLPYSRAQVPDPGRRRQTAGPDTHTRACHDFDLAATPRSAQADLPFSQVHESRAPSPAAGPPAALSGAVMQTDTADPDTSLSLDSETACTGAPERQARDTPLAHAENDLHAAGKGGARDTFTGARVLGQVLNTYILAEVNDSLVLVDQHAAHERIVYESLIKRHKRMETASQTLVVPETLELNFREASAMEDLLAPCAAVGIRVEPFGDTTFVIKSVPAVIDDRQAVPLVREILEAAMTDRGQGSEQHWLESILSSMACHNAIRANRMLRPEEMTRLLLDLEQCDNPMHCPHGRPTRITLDARALEKLFKRVV